MLRQQQQMMTMRKMSAAAMLRLPNWRRAAALHSHVVGGLVMQRGLSSKDHLQRKNVVVAAGRAAKAALAV